MKKGWFNDSRRHRLARLGIRTGRKVRQRTGVLPYKDETMFFPKKKGIKVSRDTEKATIEQPITILKETGELVTGKRMGKR